MYFKHMGARARLGVELVAEAGLAALLSPAAIPAPPGSRLARAKRFMSKKDRRGKASLCFHFLKMIINPL